MLQVEVKVPVKIKLQAKAQSSSVVVDSRERLDQIMSVPFKEILRRINFDSLLL